MKLYNVCIVGATGLVGRTILEVLAQRNIPINHLIPLASERSAGKEILFNGKQIRVQLLEPKAFDGMDYALFSAGNAISLEYAPIAVKKGAVVIDNSSAFRMQKDVPLVVPEVNPQDILKNHGIIANPNCSTIQLVVVLKPLLDAFKIKRVVVSTYQSITGAGKRAVDQLNDEIANRPVENSKLPHQIAYNVIPHIDIFFDDGYTKEEVKIMDESKKILGKNIPITATAARVPVFGGHSESVNIEFEKQCSAEEVKNILRKAPGIIVFDDPKNNKYPMPILSHNRDEVFVGRIRKDNSVKSGINLWITADNLRKGAATNAVQILEELLSKR